MPEKTTKHCSAVSANGTTYRLNGEDIFIPDRIYLIEPSETVVAHLTSVE
ncbi:hypothetical protein [Listeria costaricensis]|nr:hypothetical protein [Listeria costaricensis]